MNVQKMCVCMEMDMHDVIVCMCTNTCLYEQYLYVCVSIYAFMNMHGCAHIVCLYEYSLGLGEGVLGGSEGELV